MNTSYHKRQTIFVRSIIYGHFARRIETKDPESCSTHTWTAFLSCPYNTSLSTFISKVGFELHPSFTPNYVECTEEPYQITQSGWGEFPLTIEIHFTDKSVKPAVVKHWVRLRSILGKTPKFLKQTNKKTAELMKMRKQQMMNMLMVQNGDCSPLESTSPSIAAPMGYLYDVVGGPTPPPIPPAPASSIPRETIASGDGLGDIMDTTEDGGSAKDEESKKQQQRQLHILPQVRGSASGSGLVSVPVSVPVPNKQGDGQVPGEEGDGENENEGEGEGEEEEEEEEEDDENTLIVNEVYDELVFFKPPASFRKDLLREDHRIRRCMRQAQFIRKLKPDSKKVLKVTYGREVHEAMVVDSVIKKVKREIRNIRKFSTV